MLSPTVASSAQPRPGCPGRGEGTASLAHPPLSRAEGLLRVAEGTTEGPRDPEPHRTAWTWRPGPGSLESTPGPCAQAPPPHLDPLGARGFGALGREGPSTTQGAACLVRCVSSVFGDDKHLRSTHCTRATAPVLERVCTHGVPSPHPPGEAVPPPWWRSCPRPSSSEQMPRLVPVPPHSAPPCGLLLCQLVLGSATFVGVSLLGPRLPPALAHSARATVPTPDRKEDLRLQPRASGLRTPACLSWSYEPLNTPDPDVHEHLGCHV